MGIFMSSRDPEGQSVGVVKNISYLTHITIPSDSNPIYEYITPYVVNFDDLNYDEIAKDVKVFVNGSWIGITKKANELFTYFKN